VDGLASLTATFSISTTAYESALPLSNRAAAGFYGRVRGQSSGSTVSSSSDVAVHLRMPGCFERQGGRVVGPTDLAPAAGR